MLHRPLPGLTLAPGGSPVYDARCHRSHVKTEFAVLGILFLLFSFGSRCEASGQDTLHQLFSDRLRLCSALCIGSRRFSKCSPSLPAGEAYFPTPLRSDLAGDWLRPLNRSSRVSGQKHGAVGGSASATVQPWPGELLAAGSGGEQSRGRALAGRDGHAMSELQRALRCVLVTGAHTSVTRWMEPFYIPLIVVSKQESVECPLSPVSEPFTSRQRDRKTQLSTTNPSSTEGLGIFPLLVAPGTVEQREGRRLRLKILH